MLSRCTNPKIKGWKNYGGRGIKVCDEWLKFENFYADMGDPPKRLSLDRINNDGGYEKSNCWWADWRQQNHNKRVCASNKTGRKGVSIHCGKYRSTIKINGVHKHLCYQPLTPEGLEAAAEMYQRAADVYYGRPK
jgi:hypothetical protein